MAANTYVALDKVTVGTAIASVTFSSINQGYTDLVIVATSTQSAGPVNSKIQFNSDSGTNYSRTWLSGQGTIAASGRGSNRTALELDYYTSPGTGNQTIIQIQNYANTSVYKTALVRTGRAAEGTEAVVGLWRSTAAISTITFLLDGAGNFQAGSTFSLYGIKAQPVATAKASGGTITYAADGYTYHAFTSSGTFTPTSALTCEVMSVGAGGGGGWGNGGGGGGGELDLFTSLSASASGYTVTVGAGGSGGTGSAGVRGGQGTTSSFALGGTTYVTSLGGGGGGSGDASAGNTAGGTGGSGGGGNFGDVGGSASGSNTFAGGSGTNSHPKYSGGGGGGATAAGSNASASVGGNGGQGYLLSNINTAIQSIFSSMTRFASGGGGGTSDINGGGVNTRGVGGDGAGSGAVSNGGTNTFSATAGTSYGSGGGGGGWNGGGNASAGAGAAGLVVIRYAS
jgi:hypothetical protein